MQKLRGTNDLRREVQGKINLITSKYHQLSQASGLPTKMERMQSAGFRRVKAASKPVGSEREFMRAQFPKGTKDMTKPGEIISPRQLEEFAEKAKRYGIKLDEQLGEYGGFEKYRGDISVLDDALERILINKKELTKPIKDDTILLRYADVLDDNGAIDISTFAFVKGRTITLNRFIYDDTEYLKKEYLVAVQKGVFTKGTDYRSVVDHEMGHIFNYADKRIIIKLKSILKREAEKINMEYNDFVYTYISSQAIYKKEIIAELNAMRKGKDSAMAEKIWKEAISK